MLLESQSLRPWVATRQVAVVAPREAAEPRGLLAQGARRVFALDAAFPPEKGVEVRPAPRGIPLRDASVDTVICVPAFSSWEVERRRTVIDEARRVLNRGGVILVWLGDREGDDDATALVTGELHAAFTHVYRVPGGGAGAGVIMLASGVVQSELESARALAYPSPSNYEHGADSGDAIVEVEVFIEDEDDLGTADIEPDERVRSSTLDRELRPADVLIDRNRLRDELARRTTDLRETEEQLWRKHEEVRKERLENVRLVSEVDRLREQVERTRLVERERAAELERLGRELSQLEARYADQQGLLNTRDAQLLEAEELMRQRDEPTGSTELRARVRQLMEEVERARSREESARELMNRRERELVAASATIQGLRRAVDEHANQAANLRGQLDVAKIGLDQAEARLPRVYEQLDKRGVELRERERESTELQHKLERVTGEQQHLRNSLKLRQGEHEELKSVYATLEQELAAARRELSAVREANTELERALALRASREGEESRVTEDSVVRWPPDAVSEVRRLREQLAGLSSQHALDLARRQEQKRVRFSDDRVRLGRAQLEARVRAEEQEYMLIQLENAEQKIWEMMDAEGRNAARLAAGLAQLEKQREQYDDLVDELGVTRRLLQRERSRSDDLERLLTTEHAKLARAGIDVEEIPSHAKLAQGRASMLSASESMSARINDVLNQAELSEREREPLYTPAVDDYAAAATHVGAPSPVAELDAKLLSIINDEEPVPSLDFSALPTAPDADEVDIEIDEE